MKFEDAASLLVAEARALLEAAERREPVSLARARAFARACLELTEIGRLAVSFLGGGAFAAARLVALAAKVASVDPAEAQRIAADEAGWQALDQDDRAPQGQRTSSAAPRKAR